MGGESCEGKYEWLEVSGRGEGEERGYRVYDFVALLLSDTKIATIGRLTIVENQVLIV